MVLDASQIEAPKPLGRARSLPSGCVVECPGCAFRETDYDLAVDKKRLFVNECLRKAGVPARVEGMVPAPHGLRWKYRARVRLHAEFSRGSWHFGLRRREGRAWRVVDIPECPVQTDALNAALTLLRSVLSTQGAVPIVMVAVDADILTLVVKSKTTPIGLRELDWAAFLAATGFRRVQVNCHPSAGRRVFAEGAFQLLAQQGSSQEGLLFAQNLEPLHRYALDQAAKYFQPLARRAVLDLYSGTGASLQRWRRDGATTLGVELMGRACQAARMQGLEVLQGRVEHRLPQIREWMSGPDQAARDIVVFANPPRTGLDTSVTQFLAHELRASRLVILSCSAGTLARDLSILAPSFDVERVLALDFFPQTHHVETLVFLRSHEHS